MYQRQSTFVNRYIYLLSFNTECAVSRYVEAAHKYNHGEVDSIFDAVNYSYFLKGQSFLGNSRAECLVEIFTIPPSPLFFISPNDVTSYTLFPDL